MANSTLNTDITANNEQFKKTVNDTKKVAKSLNEQLYKDLKALGIGATITKVFKDGYEGLDRMTASAEKLGISAQSFQFLEYAAKRSDISIDSLEMSLRKLRLSLSKAAPKNDPLAALGLSRSDLQSMNIDSAFEKVIGALQKIDQAQQIDLGTKLFGKNFQDLMELAHGDLSQLKKEFDAVGGAIDVSGYAALDKQVDDLTQSYLQLSRQFFLTFGPPVFATINAFSSAMKGISVVSNGIGEGATATRNLVAGQYNPNDMMFGLNDPVFMRQRRNAVAPPLATNSSAGASAAAAGTSILKLADAATVATAAFKNLGAKLNLKDFLGLTPQSGQDYLSSILTPITQVQDEYFTKAANNIRDYVASGADLQGVKVQSSLAFARSIANSYNNPGEGLTNSGMMNAITELTNLVNKAEPKMNKDVTIKLDYDQNGIIKAVIGSDQFGNISGQIVRSITSKEAASTIATGG